MRINARLDDSYEEKFLRVQQASNKNRTEILKDALDMYFTEEIKQVGQIAWEQNQKILKMVGGIVSGPENLSVNYKKMISQGLREKYDID